MPSPLSDQILLQAEDVQLILDKPNVIPVFVGSEESYATAHIPNSIHVAPAQLVCGIAPAVGKIADEEELSRLFSRLGFSSDSIIIAYDDEGGGWAGRLIWTLDVINHANYHYLDGGITAWKSLHLPLEKKKTAREPSTYTVKIDHDQLLTTQQIIDQLGSENVAIWDARSAPEYNGNKIVAARAGHIPGAANLDWLHLIDRSNALRLIPLEKIRTMLEERGISADKSILTHCQTHHRSGLSYLVGKILGLNIKAYDGSWSEWGNLPDTPIEK